MKIIKQPTYKVIECDCGAIFQPEAGDDFDTKKYVMGCFMSICCPACGKSHPVETEKEKGTPPETCASCGVIIPEGGQYCPNCEKGVKHDTRK